MTAPTPPDGNDEVIRVVYQAVADYSQLLRETRRARTETARLKQEVDGLAGASTHRVKVTADTGQTQAELARVLRDVVIKAKVVVDAIKSRAEISRALRDVAVKAKVMVDGIAARAEIQRALRNLTVPVRLQVDADTSRAAAQLTQALRDTAVRVAVELDERGVTEKFRALLAHLETLGSVDIAVNVRADAIERIEAAAERLQRIRDDVQGGGGGPGRHRADDDEPRVARPAGVPRGVSRAASVVSVGGPLLAAAIPLAAGLTGAVGTVAAAFTAAAGAAGVFAVAAIGAMSRVGKAVEEYEKSGTLAKGPLGRVVEQVEAVKRRYAELQAATETDVFAVFARGLQIAVDLLDKIQPLISVVARGIDAALAQVQDAINGPGFDEFLAFVGAEGPHAIGQFTKALINIGGGLFKLLKQFQPFVRGFVDGFAAMAERFNAWASNLDNNDKFQRFLDYCMDNVPKLVDTFVNLVEAAANLLVAFAPIGDAMLAIANGALAVIAALPPGVLTAIGVAVLGVAVAIKALQAATAVQRGLRGLSGALDDIGGKSRKAKGGLDLLGGGFGKLGVFALAFMALNGPLDTLADKQDAAADAAEKHGRALDELAQKIVDAKGATGGPGIRQASYDALGEYSFKADVLDASDPRNTANRGQGADHPLSGRRLTATMDLPQAAQYAGVDLADLTSGATGKDDPAYSRALAQFDKYIAERQAKLQELLKDPANNRQQISQVKADLGIVGDARDAYKRLGGAQGEVAGKTQALTDAQKRQAAAVGDTADATKDAAEEIKKAGDAAQYAAGQYADAAAASAEIRKRLAETDFSSDASMAAYNNAASALDAYDQQIQAVADAEQSLDDAQHNARRSQEALTDARAAAVERIKDVQRALRDMTLDERQAKLDVRRADERLNKVIADGGTPDEIEQARLDNERAHNRLNDFNQDERPDRKALKDELGRGVEGNKALQDAKRASDNAQRQVETANRNLGTAGTKLADLHFAFAAAAGALGLSEKQVRTLRGNMDRLKTKTVKVVLDTKDADAKLAALLQGQYAMQLLASGMSWDQAWAQALKAVPSARSASDAKEPASPRSISPVNRATGGPVPAPVVVAGPVRGAGSGTSDSVLTRLPVGGPARLSAGEHIVTDAEVRAAPGGHDYLEAFRAGLRARRPWTPPPPAARYAMGGPARSWSAMLPAFRMPAVAAAGVPGYAAGGAVRAAQQVGGATDRSLTIHGGIHVTNAVPEPASVSLYQQIRKAAAGD